MPSLSQWEILLFCFCAFFTCPHYSLTFFLAHQAVLGSSWTLVPTAVKSAISLRILGSFYRRIFLSTKFWVLDVFIAVGHLYSQPLSVERHRICMYIAIYATSHPSSDIFLTHSGSTFSPKGHKLWSSSPNDFCIKWFNGWRKIERRKGGKEEREERRREGREGGRQALLFKFKFTEISLWNWDTLKNFWQNKNRAESLNVYMLNMGGLAK